MGAGHARPALPSVPPAQDAAWTALLTIMAAEDNRLDLPANLHTPVVDALRAKQDEEMRTLLTLTRSSIPEVQRRAIRALGRYESRAFTATLLQFLVTGPFRDEAAVAVVGSLRGDPLPADASNRQVHMVFEALTELASTDRSADFSVYVEAIGRLPYASDGDVKAAEAFLLRMMQRNDSDPQLRQHDADIAGALENLARVHGRLSQLSSETIDWLRRIAADRSAKYGVSSQTEAMRALIAGRGLDEETLRVTARQLKAGSDELRRLSAMALAGAGSPLVPSERSELIKVLMNDDRLAVKIEAVRAYARQEARGNGCMPLLEVLKDRDVPLVLAAIDLLGDSCKEDANVTDRLVAEARTPPPAEWHRAAHALVSLSKRDPERAKIPLLADTAHSVWQVRMYAARAAAVMNDVDALERFVKDDHPNVREAALPAFRRLKGDESDPVLLDVLLHATDYQLLHTAAREAKGSANPAMSAALIDALRRVTAEKKDTSRDVRLALLERIDELGDPDQAGQIVSLLQDFDIKVALAAAGTLQKWTGRYAEIAPQLQPRPPLPSSSELQDAGSHPARITLRSGNKLTIDLLPDAAPLASIRFWRLAHAGYYTGLTFHRIEPNFVIQGGSPNANEYSGDGPYVHDEIGRRSNSAGSVGLSTRGRDTGDAQFYINLVDNRRLDFDYTVFGSAGSISVIERILEGDAIEKITFDKEENEGVLRWSLPVCAAAAAAK